MAMEITTGLASVADVVLAVAAFFGFTAAFPVAAADLGSALLSLTCFMVVVTLNL
jgi:hypothetical protein